MCYMVFVPSERMQIKRAAPPQKKGAFTNHTPKNLIPL